MPNVKLILALCVLSGFLGLTLPAQQSHAADPPACDQYKCKNVAYWWDGDPSVIKSAAVPGMDVAAFQAIQSIYTKTSTFDLPVGNTGALIDIRTYPGCTPWCGKDANGVWQTYQEVDKVGAPTVVMKDQVQSTCKDLGKVVGSKQAPQINGNAKAKNTPPGYVPPQ